jgi:hypothetical protein
MSWLVVSFLVGLAPVALLMGWHMVRYAVWVRKFKAATEMDYEMGAGMEAFLKAQREMLERRRAFFEEAKVA